MSKRRDLTRGEGIKRGNTVCVSVCVLASLQHLLSLFKEKKYSTNLRNPFFQKNTVHLRVIRSCPPLSPKQRRDKCPISIHSSSPHSKTTCQTEYATTHLEQKTDPDLSPSLHPSNHSQGRGGGMRGARGGGFSAPRGGGRHGGPQGPQPTLDKPKREAILDLAKYVNARIRVKFTGGREGVCL